MKKEHPIRTLLGLKQVEIAMMLGISRQQWSMVELGKRDLSLKPKERLAEMLLFLKTLESNGKELHVPDNKTAIEFAERQLRENEYQRLTLERNIANAEKKRATQVRLALLNEFLEKQTDETGRQSGFILMHTNKTSASKKSGDVDTLLVEYRHQLDLLRYEKSLLESKIKNNFKFSQ